MDTATADGVRLVPPDELPACIEYVVERAQDFVLVVGVPLHGRPVLDEALRRVARRGGSVRVVVTPAHVLAAAREVAGLVAEGAIVLVSDRPLRALVATEDAAVEAPSSFVDVPRAGRPGALVTRSGAGARWARIVAMAKLAQFRTRPAMRVAQRWVPAHPEPWREVFRALFRS